MNIVRSGASSYYCAEMVQLAMLLERNGYAHEAPLSQYEASRWRNARSLLVVYHNGTILMQGADTATPRRIFDALIGQAALPF